MDISDLFSQSTVYFKECFFLNMFRIVNLRTSHAANTFLKSGKLVATRDIQKGESIRVPKPDRIHRTLKERKEIARLADMSYYHAMKN